MGKELIVDPGHSFASQSLLLILVVWENDNKDGLFWRWCSSTLASSPPPHASRVTSSRSLCAWCWADSLLSPQTLYSFLVPSVFTWRICLTCWPWTFYTCMWPSPSLSHLLVRSRHGSCIPRSYSVSETTASAFLFLPGPSSFLIYLPSPWWCFDLIAASHLVAGPLHQIRQYFPPLISLLNQFRIYRSFKSLVSLAVCICLTKPQPRWSQISVFSCLHCPVEVGSTECLDSASKKIKCPSF